MIRAAVVAVLLAALAALAGCDRGDQHQAVTCGPAASSCLILYLDNGKILKAVADPATAQPTPYGTLVFQEPNGNTYIWNGRYLWRVGHPDL